MIHLRNKVYNEDNVCEIDTINNISDILDMLRSNDTFIKALIKDQEYSEFINNKYIFTDKAISDKCLIKLIEGSEVNEYIIESNEFVGTFIDSRDLKINNNSDYLFLYDENMSVIVPVVKVKDENKEYYKIYMDNLQYVKEFLLDKCDGCSCTSLKELLFNLYPEINTGIHNKYTDFKGTVCSDCLSKMEKGLPLENEKSQGDQAAGDVTEKIDEFSSIDEILKFCGMDQKEELEQMLKNKIFNE